MELEFTECIKSTHSVFLVEKLGVMGQTVRYIVQDFANLDGHSKAYSSGGRLAILARMCKYASIKGFVPN